MDLFLLSADLYGIAADLIISAAAFMALRHVWKASRDDKTKNETERGDYLERIKELTETLEKVQELRVKEALEADDKYHEAVKQHADRLQELANMISQLQYIIMLALHIDSVKLPHTGPSDGGAPTNA